jgi:hypothetical protein
MFVLATLVYPCVLALLCAGAGLLVDRVGGSFLPGALLPVVGAAALIGLSQLTTYIVFLAPATPYLLALFALAGFALGRPRVAAMFGWRSTQASGSAMLEGARSSEQSRPIETPGSGSATVGVTGSAGSGPIETLGPGPVERPGTDQAEAPTGGQRGRRQFGWQLAVPVIAYVAALAPVLFAGRPSFSSYGVLTDSAFHMLGADFLIHHGQDYSHLDLHNSPGQYLNDYYNTYYPSGADTFFGGSALLVRVPLIWAFQPFNAFMLALCTGPAWVLVRRFGLDGWLAALATLTVTLPALVYGYELIASVKEISSLPLILALGALVVLYPRWLRGPPRGAIPFALVAAAGVSALGVAFGAWVLTAVVVLVAVAVWEIASGGVAADDTAPRDVVASGSTTPGSITSGNAVSETPGPGVRASDRSSPRGLLLLVATGLLVAFVAALGTWLELSGSLQIARNIASTNNPGNLQNPLRTVQTLGTWLVSSYKHVPVGGALTVSYTLALLALASAVLGAAYVVYRREYALAAWIALTLAVWLGLTAYGTTWADGKALMLTSPVVVLLAWGGVAALRDWGRVRPASQPRSGSVPERTARSAPRPAFRSAFRWAAALLALALAGGVAASDALQYHGSNLAPTARYEELASIGSRFAGRGPALFTDYDEYALYELRDLDVGGPGFMYPPPAVAQTEGQPANLDLIAPAALRSYPLIVTRRDPAAARPPAAYRLLYQGAYYEVWGRRPGAPAALDHLAPASTPAAGESATKASDTRTDGQASGQAGARASRLVGGRLIECSRVAGLAQLAETHGAQLVSARPPQIVPIDVARSLHPAWAESRDGLLMSRAGRLTATFAIPHAGLWDLWLQGEIMPAVEVGVDGRPLASISGQLSGVATDPDTTAPLHVRFTAGPHRLTITRGSSNLLAPGSGGSAILDSIFLTPVGAGGQATLHVTPAAEWRSLCGRALEWIEVLRE